MTRHFGPLAALSLAIALGGNAVAQERTQWLGSWYAAPQPAWDSSFILPMNVPAHLVDQTVRETVRISAGGNRIRLVFSNRYGREPLSLDGVRVAPEGDASQSRALTFSASPWP